METILMDGVRGVPPKGGGTLLYIYGRNENEGEKSRP